jgi:CheY-like chemotaxis protein
VRPSFGLKNLAPKKLSKFRSNGAVARLPQIHFTVPLIGITPFSQANIGSAPDFRFASRTLLFGSGPESGRRCYLWSEARAEQDVNMIESATILVADDCQDDVELFKAAIKRAGLSNPVRSFADGAEAIEYLRQEHNTFLDESSAPLLFFLDLNMPGCTGFAVLDWLRRQSHLQNLPTIVLSNSDLPSDIERSLRLGAHGYWVKPTRFEDLVALARRLKELLTRVTDRIEQDEPAAALA